MSKGSTPRPRSVKREEYEKAWERTFGAKNGTMERMRAALDGEMLNPFSYAASIVGQQKDACVRPS